MLVFAVIFAIVTACNVAVSQLFPSLYFSSLASERDAIVYLINIRTLPQFHSELNRLTAIYGPQLRDEVFKDERTRDAYIKELESLSEASPAFRDINYQLSVLYERKGDNETSRKYLERARAVDPSI